MNLGTIRAEVQARGYDYLSTARCTTLINMAQNEILSYMPWPFMETSVGPSASPLTISNLDQILSVVAVDGNVKRELSQQDRRFILNLDPDLTQTGAPMAYWLEGNVVTVWPSSTTDNVTVRYIPVPTDLASDSDTPAIPTQFHDLIVLGAVFQAQMDNDDMQGAQFTRSVWQNRIDGMVQRVMGRNLAGPTLMTVTDPRNF